MHPMLKRAREIEDQFIAYRRQFHRHPEAGFKEEQTCATVMAFLDSLQIPHQRMAVTGVVGLIEGGIPGDRCIAIRADMDALPMDERSGVAFASEVPGMMHSCGHDGHTAILMGVAALLKEKQAEIKGNIKLFFQPCEEGPGTGGAFPMIQEGCMENPKVDAAIGLHVHTTDGCATGEIAVKDGPLNASSGGWAITINGKGGHGSSPHLSVDAIVCAAQVVTALQTIASREIDPMSSIVLSIGKIVGGYRTNIIADQVVLEGTLRTTEMEVRASVGERIERIVKGVCDAYRCTGTVDMRQGRPPVINDAGMTDLFAKSAAKILGEDKVKRIPKASMGGEDFAFFAQMVPSTYVRLGARNEALGMTYPAHHPQFDFDEQAIAIGMACLAQTALDYLD